jgi:dihydroflavonol-4-reductase
VHVSDLASGMIAAAERGERLPAPSVASSSTGVHLETPSSHVSMDGQGYYFLTSDEHLKFSELNRLIARAVGRPNAWTIRLPLPGIWVVAACTELVSRLTRRPDYVNFDRARELTGGHWICSSEKAHRDLGFVPGASLSQRIEQTAQWYKENGWM